MKKNYPLGISQAMVDAAEDLFLAMTMEQTVEPVVREYSKRILGRHQFQCSEKWRNYFSDRVILDPEKVYLLSDEDAAVYFAEAFKERDRAGLKVSHPQNCPLLEARNLRLQAENTLLLRLSEHPRLDSLKPHVLSLDERTRAMELALKLLAPYVRNGDEIARMAASLDADA